MEGALRAPTLPSRGLHRSCAAPRRRDPASIRIGGPLLPAALRLRKRNQQFQHFMTVLVPEVDLDGGRIHVHILVDHLEQFAAQKRQVVRSAAGIAFLGDDDAQPFLRDAGRRWRFAKQSE
jgi:hypothetical protein